MSVSFCSVIYSCSVWTIVNYLNWENVVSALGSSYKFTWNSISSSTFSNQVSKHYPKEASASSTLKWINNSELAGPIRLLFCPQLNFCAEFEKFDSRIFCSQFSEQNLHKTCFVLHLCSFALRIIFAAIPIAWILERPKIWVNFTSFRGSFTKMACLMFWSVPQLPNSPIFLEYSCFFEFLAVFSN